MTGRQWQQLTALTQNAMTHTDPSLRFSDAGGMAIAGHATTWAWSLRSTGGTHSRPGRAAAIASRRPRTCP